MTTGQSADSPRKPPSLDDDPELAAIVVRVRSRPDPVFGEHDRHKYTSLPRCAAELVTLGVEGDKARLVFLLLFLVTNFHPGGCFVVPLEELGAITRLRVRDVREALASLHRQKVVVWAPHKRHVFIKAAAHRNIFGTKVVKNWQGHLASMGVSPAVDAARAMMAPDTVSDNRVQGSALNAQRSAEPQPSDSRSDTPIRPRKDPFDLDGHELPVPERWTDELIHAAFDEDDDQAQELIVETLQLAQQTQRPDNLDRPWYIREQVAKRLAEGKSPEHLMRCIWCALDKAERSNDPAFLCTPACFGDVHDRNPAATMQVMVAREFHDEEADHRALE